MVAVKTSMGLVRSRIRLTEIRLVFNFLLKFFSFLLLREILYAMPNFIFCEICVFFFSSFQMPVCQFFLRGKCSNDNCPYSHVNVSKKAEVCEDFLKGFCSRGQQVCLLLLFIIILFPAIICIAFELELH